ncbi:helix-turn-helix protein [Stieleria neptunia]|uniref:Helix-turn-helix protein n=1 Tax=Stieleria neptunia TaxID=2527979 RepID=A0A518HP95_9BACT|nr:HigA family addiction module antitoxin [Stieleria neptunia]QDV42664.1 helix-turn-helix protein [Stieleria neptunia]
MASITPAPYRPDRVSPPGETIRDMLDDVEMSQVELARRMGRPANKVNQIIQGKKAITADTALELENVLGLPASFWLRREQYYQLARSAQAQLEKQKQVCEIAKEFPCAEMARLGWIEKKTTWLEKYQELLRFFGTAKLDALNHAVELAPSFRKSDGKEACQKALAAWLRKGVIEARKIEKGSFSNQRTIRELGVFRELTRRGVENMERDLQDVASGLGIGVVFVPHLARTYVGGAAYWCGDSPVIQLSYRWKRHDILWFNFFHELAHILLHPRTETFLDDFSADQAKHEVEANQFAADCLIPAEEWSAFVDTGQFSVSSVEEFAKKVGIAGSLVVGRLQKEQHVSYKKLRQFHVSISG